MVDGHEVCAGGERSFDLELDESMYDGGKNMATAEHSFADGHEIGHRVVAIANQLLRVSTMISSFQLGCGEDTSCRFDEMRAWTGISLDKPPKWIAQ